MADAPNYGSSYLAPKTAFDEPETTADPFEYGVSESQTAARIIENLAKEREGLRRQVQAGQEQIRVLSQRLVDVTNQLRNLGDS